MTIPYKSRVVALIEGEPFELVRFRKWPAQKSIRFATEGLSWPWRVETTTDNRNTLTPRWSPPGYEAKRKRAAHASAVQQSKSL